MLCPTEEQHKKCLEKLCKIPLVGMMGGALTPISAMSGGLLPSCCPGPNQANPADLAKDADSAEGAASRIKKEEAEAKARRAAVRYLGTVDCRRFVEAEAALIKSLRGDTNECVRWEAAMSLANGCCCTKNVLQALVITVSGKKTNEPPECSPRVRAAAAYALERCLNRYCETDMPKPPERPEGAEKEKEKEKDKKAAALDPDVQEAVIALNWYKYQTQRPAFVLSATQAPPLAQEAPLPQGILQVAATVTAVPQALPPQPAPQGALPAMVELAPPTGQRDLWSIMRYSTMRRQ
jgi:hypothetical protein